MTLTIPLFRCFCLFFHAVVVFNLVSATELTFELADDDIQCFFEEIDKGEKFSLDYQVITGGNYDVDCSVLDPGENVLYEESKKQYDHFSHTAEETGVYKVCFSNEFSTFSHKTVYFDLQTGEEPALIPEMHNRVSALTQMESSSVLIHEILKTISESQTHYRLREAIDRIRADEIHEHVMYWSIGETVILFVVSISQVVMLKSFFTDKKPLPGLSS